MFEYVIIGIRLSEFVFESNRKAAFSPLDLQY